MFDRVIAIIIILLLLFGVVKVVNTILAPGALERHFTMSGVYAVCKPKGYEAVCFLDADSKDGGLSCIPLSQAGGFCK